MANTVRNFENQFKLHTGFTDLHFGKKNEILNLKKTPNELDIVEFFQNVQKMETQNSAFATIEKLQYEKEESKVVKISNSQTKQFSALTVNVPNNPDCKSGTEKYMNTGFTDLHFGKKNEILNHKNTKNELAADSKLLSSFIGNNIKDNSKWFVEKFGQETEAKVGIVETTLRNSFKIQFKNCLQMAYTVRNFENQFKLNTGFTDLHFGKKNEILNLKNSKTNWQQKVSYFKVLLGIALKTTVNGP